MYSNQHSQLVLTQLTLYTAKAITVSHRIIRSWYIGHWWVGCCIRYNDLTVPNETTHPSTPSVLITILLYTGLTFCGFNVPKGEQYAVNEQAACIQVCLKLTNFSKHHTHFTFSVSRSSSRAVTRQKKLTQLISNKLNFQKTHKSNNVRIEGHT